MKHGTHWESRWLSLQVGVRLNSRRAAVVTSRCHVVYMPQHRDRTVTPHKQLQPLPIYIWGSAEISSGSAQTLRGCTASHELQSHHDHGFCVSCAIVAVQSKATWRTLLLEGRWRTHSKGSFLAKFKKCLLSAHGRTLFSFLRQYGCCFSKLEACQLSSAVGNTLTADKYLNTMPLQKTLFNNATFSHSVCRTHFKRWYALKAGDLLLYSYRPYAQWTKVLCVFLN